MNEIRALDADQLRWMCDSAQLDFDTTEDLEELDKILGQTRALDAVQFAIGMSQPGYNLYALGPPGMGKRTVVKQFVEKNAGAQQTPDDWCYVYNFQQPHKPHALRLPTGKGAQFRADMENLVEDLQTSIPAALDVEEHQNRVQEIEEEFKERSDRAFSELAQRAEAQGIRLLRTPSGFALAPVRDGGVLSPEEFQKLPQEEQQRVEHVINSLQAELQEILEEAPKWRKEARDKIKELNRETTRFAISHAIAQTKQQYSDLPVVVRRLGAVEQDVLEHIDDFQPQDDEMPAILGIPLPERSAIHRYKVNLLVDNSSTKGAAVVHEDHPSYQNLLGRVEHRPHMGSLVTEFTLIKPGALHRANGGYLIIEAQKLLRQPFAWEGLKRALQSRNLKIESPGEAWSLISTVSLEPEPIPLDLKVLLLGDRLSYYLLHQYDLDFAELFKVAADFEDEIERTPENCRLYAQFIATLVRREHQRPLDRSAVARVLEHSVRAAGDSEKLSMHMRTVADVLHEADYWAAEDGAPVVTSAHIERAIEKQIHRVDRVRQQVQEQIRRGLILIDTEGEQVGQVNGLSVMDMGNFSFGRPSRITATARLGKGEVIDIEREAELGGATHSKGVLILSSFLASRYAQDAPLSLSASLAFEQSYGMVDGDSASVGELCALISALADAPVRQNLAVTGSVNQHGQVQAIGGVNEKIEGFFDLCRWRGLTGDQGVLIPASNVKHLMLRPDVVAAVKEGKFHVYPIETVDQAIALLTGQPSGQRDKNGRYAPRTMNGRVEKRLKELSQLRRDFAESKKQETSHE